MIYCNICLSPVWSRCRQKASRGIRDLSVFYLIFVMSARHCGPIFHIRYHCLINGYEEHFDFEGGIAVKIVGRLSLVVLFVLQREKLSMPMYRWEKYPQTWKYGKQGEDMSVLNRYVINYIRTYSMFSTLSMLLINVFQKSRILYCLPDFMFKLIFHCYITTAKIQKDCFHQYFVL